MTTLLTGASGFVGSWIARMLNPRPGELRVLARPGSDLSLLAELPIEIVYGDLLDRVSLDAALDGATHVYHAAGLISFKQEDADRVRQVNMEGSANLFEAALAADVERFVYTGSIFAFGPAPDPTNPPDENGGGQLDDLLNIPYVQAKCDAAQVASAARKHDLPLIRLYPGLCIGPDDFGRSSSGTIDAWLRGQLPAIIDGGGICLMDVRDAAAAHIAAMQHGAPGEDYLATGYNITLPDLFARLARIAGQRPPLTLPAWLGVPLAQIVERLGWFPALDAAQARLMTRHWWYNTQRAERELGISFRSFDDTLVETVAWLRAHSPR